MKSADEQKELYVFLIWMIFPEFSHLLVRTAVRVNYFTLSFPPVREIYWIYWGWKSSCSLCVLSLHSFLVPPVTFIVFSSILRKPTPCVMRMRPPHLCATTAPAWWRLALPGMMPLGLSFPPLLAAHVIRYVFPFSPAVLLFNNRQTKRYSIYCFKFYFAGKAWTVIKGEELVGQRTHCFSSLSPLLIIFLRFRWLHLKPLKLPWQYKSP